MSPLHGRPKADAFPPGGTARSARVPTPVPLHGRPKADAFPARPGRAQRGGAHMSPSHGRPKMGETPHGGVARSAGVHTQ